MARLTILGIKNISSEIKEAGVMAGCNKWQMLFKVEIPSARSPIMLGINQVIMQCLAMVVIAINTTATPISNASPNLNPCNLTNKS